MARVIRISASDAKYGGNIYESNINKALQNFNITTFFALSWVPKKIRYFFAPIFYLLNFIKCNFCDADIVIVPLEAISFLSKKKKNIVVVHHIDHSFSSFFSSLNQIFTYFLLVLNKNRINKIVVVSEYWEKYLQGKGFNNIQIIYNDIDISLRDEVKKSIRNFRVEGKTNIYIGNFHKKKGTYDLLSLLKDHYVLHTSGYKGQQIEGLINHSRLSYPDYLKLLSDMDVCITYSRFREGWCRTAHEALILGTKVIGSGYGGMGELLKGSSQPIASDYLSLKIALENYDLFEIDSDYVTSFDFERFKKSWSELVEKL